MSSGSFLQRGVVIMVGNGLVALVGIGALRVYTELAPQAVYGAASLVLGALVLGTQIILQPVAHTQLRYHSEALAEGRADSFTAEVLRWSLRGAAVLIVCSAIATGLWSLQDGAPAALPMFVATTVWFIVYAIYGAMLSRLHAEQQMLRFMGMRLGEAVLTVVATALLLGASLRPESFVFGRGVSHLLVLAVALLLVPWPVLALGRRCIRLLTGRPGGDQRVAQRFRERLWRYGAPFVPLSLLAWFAHTADRYILAAVLDVEAAGQYIPVFAIASAGFIIANGAVGDMFRPALFEAESADDHRGANRIFLSWLGSYAAISFVGLGALLFLHEWVALVTLAEPYREGAGILMIWIAGGYAISGFTMAFENRLFSLERSSSVLAPQVVGAVANVVLTFTLVQHSGLVGAAQGSCGSFVLQFIVTAAILWRALRARRPASA